MTDTATTTGPGTTSSRPVNAEPRTLSQRTLARRIRTLIADGPLPPAVALEAANELDRLTRRPDLSELPDQDLVDQLHDLDQPTATAAAIEIVRLRGLCRTLFFDCDTHTSRYRPDSVTIVVPGRLHALIRTEARRP